MKILYAAHVHGDFGTEDSMLTILNEYAQQLQPDATILVGNMVKDVLSEEQMAALEFHKNATAFVRCVQDRGEYPGLDRVVTELARKPSLVVAGSPPVITIPDLAKKIIEDLRFPHAEVKKYAKCFLSGLEKKYEEQNPEQLMKEALDNMQEQYCVLDKELKDVSSLYMLPGSCDSPLFDKFFDESTIHLKLRMLGNAKIAGYGSSYHFVRDLSIPTPLHYPYFEKEINHTLGLYASEGVAHFTKMKPDVIVSYTPPKEKLSDDDSEIGSIALSDYIDLADPFLVLIGLPHTIQKARCDPLHTVHVYPGSLGRGYGSEGGEFCVLDCDDRAKECREIEFYHITPHTKKVNIVKKISLEELQRKYNQQDNKS